MLTSLAMPGLLGAVLGCGPGAPLDRIGGAEQGQRGDTGRSGHVGNSSVWSHKKLSLPDEIGGFCQGQGAGQIERRGVVCDFPNHSHLIRSATARENDQQGILLNFPDQLDPVFQRP